MAQDNVHYTYQQQMKSCGKANCTRCRHGSPGHGPYWYAYWNDGGRQRSRYLGKHAPPGYADTPKTRQAVEVPEAQRPLSTYSVRVRQQPPLRVETLGHFAVWRGEEPVRTAAWERQKAGMLFGILLSRPNHMLRREQIIELLWPDVRGTAGERRLRDTARQLRRFLDVAGIENSHLRAVNDQLLLVPTQDADVHTAWLDAERFEQLALAAEQSSDVGACRRALAHYGGEYLAAWIYEDWATERRDALQDRYLAVLRRCATLAQEQGIPDEAEQCLRRILVIDPCDEAAACALMTLLRSLGRFVDGIRVYTMLETALRKELDTEPDPETRRVRDRLAEALRTPPASAVLPERPATKLRTNVPTAISRFVGRAREQAAVSQLLQASRLVTLTGIGGVGKTRLAIAVGLSVIDSYQDGMWLADLAALPVQADSARTLVCQTIARVLGVQAAASQPLEQTIQEFLSSRRLLLILDNCEHLILPCSELSRSLLEGCPQLTILTTSREAFGLAEEITWAVPPLSLPEAGRAGPDELARSEAVQLFVIRAQAKQVEFALTTRNARAVAAVCSKLDGIPLALELAAARLSFLSIDQIASRLDDRFGLLSGGGRGVLPRQQTLRAALDWSYALLDEPERVLLRRLSVFAGGCELEAIEVICTGEGVEATIVLDILGALVNKSLVLAENHEGSTRYRLLDTVRQYGRVHLAAWGEEEALSDRHLSWYLVLVERAESELRGAKQAYWLQRLEADHDNIRAALEWAIQRPATGDRGLRLAGAIWQFWYMRNYQIEGRDWLERVLAADVSGDAELKAKALNGAGCLAYIQWEMPQAVALLEESLHQARDAGNNRAIARALTNLASIAGDQARYHDALPLLEESVTIFRELGDEANTATALLNTGETLLRLEDTERSAIYVEESLRISRKHGYTLGTAIALSSLASVKRMQGDLEQAAKMADESLELARQIDSHRYIASSLVVRSAIARDQGDTERALAYYREALFLASQIKDEEKIRASIEGVAAAAASATEPVTRADGNALGPARLAYATRLLAATEALVTRAPRSPSEVSEFNPLVLRLRSEQGDELFAQHWATGRQLSREAAIDLALDDTPTLSDLR